MDVNSRDPSQNIIPFRIKGVEVGRFDICGNLGIGTSTPTARLDVSGNARISGELYVDGFELKSLIPGVVVNMDSQPAASTALNRQKKQSIPLSAASTLSTSDIVAKMSGVSVGKTQSYGVGAAQMVSYGNIVVAVGEGTNSIAYSLVNPPTASSWVGIQNSANTFTVRGRNITYANGTWVAVGEGTNSIAYSTMTPPVASSWVGIPTGSSFNGAVNTFYTSARDIAYGNGAWVATGEGTNSLSYSLANPPTAESWVGIPLASTIFGTISNSISFGNGTWVATGNGTNGIAYSTQTPPTRDSWITVPLNNTNDAGSQNVFNTYACNVIYANGVWLAAGNGDNTLCYSVENPPIAGSWMPITRAALFGNAVCWSVAYGNGTWVASASSTTIFAYSTARIPHSSSWVVMRGPTPSSSGEQINHITFNAATNTWYFMGDIGTNCMFYSTATPPVPATWVGVQRSTGAFTTQAFGAVGITTPAFTSPVNVARLDNKVTFPANRMLAVGGGGAVDVLARSSLTPAPAVTGTISYSDDDGATWQMVPGGATNAMFSSPADIAAGTTSFGVGGSRGANAVAWNGEKWVAAGNGRTNSLAFSDDGGMTWTGITGKSVFSVEARDVAWNGQMWVAVGRGVLFSTAYSYDGISWMGPVTDDVSGTPINVFSYDIAGPTAAASDISGGGNHVIWTGKMWVATGTRTLIAGSSPAAYYTIAYSLDGKSWTGVAESGATSTGFDMYAHGVAWNGRNYIATGRGTTNTLAFSTDIASSWQGLGNTVFSVWGRGITWGARRWMATGRGTNTVAYSTNGRNWQGCGANVFKPLRRFMAMGDTGLYTTVASGQPQRGVAVSYSDDGVTWDAPVVNQGVEFSSTLGLGSANYSTRSTLFTNQFILTNAITDNASQHTGLMYSSDGGASWARVPGTSDISNNGGTEMTVANSGAFSLAMNTARTRFFLGGGDAANATRKAYFSNDGFNWRNGISSPNTSQMAWVYASLWVGGGYNRWLIGGNDAGTNGNGRIMYSGDAESVAAWLAASPGTYTGTVVSCFAANPDFSVILAGIDAASGNAIHRSVNGGANWAATTSTFIGRVRSIAFSPSLGRWVAVGGGAAYNTIMYSTDATGTGWNVSPQGGRGGAASIFKIGSEVTRVIWDAVGGRFLVGGWNGQTGLTNLTNVAGLESTTNNHPGYTMAYSADGINWTPVTVRVSDDAGAPPGSTSGTAFGPFLTHCREIMALDMSGDFTPINTGYSVTWNSYANRFIATGNGTTPVVYSSDGGVTWTPANQQPQQQAIVVAGGLSGTSGSSTTASPITYSMDGKTWHQGIGAKEIFGSSGLVTCVKYGQTSTAISPNGRIWVAGGQPNSGTSCLAFSQNGVRWTAITSGTTMMTNVRAIAYAPLEQLASGASGASGASSGIGNGIWVAGGDTTNSLAFSYDGISWSEVPNSLTILSRCNACTFGNGLFVAGGVASTSGAATAIDSTANMCYSTDGINWKLIRGSSARIASGTSIGCITYGRDETGRGLWVAGAVGSTTISILYSYNGIDWIGVPSSGTNLSSSVTGIAYGVSASTGQGVWIASVYRSAAQGNYSFISSSNGRDGWTAVANTKTGLFDSNTTGATGISYLNGVWYATGFSAGISAGRTLAYSYEGTGAWFGVYPTSMIYGTSVATFSATDMRCVATSADYMIPVGSSAGSTTSTGMTAAAGTPSSLSPVRNIAWTAGVGSAYLQHPTLLFGTDNTRAGTATRTATAISADGGRTWGSSTVSLAHSAFRGGVCNDAFWNGSIWVAVGYDATTGAKVAKSKDGLTWTQIPGGNIPIVGVLYSIMWNGRVWMVGGDGSPTNDANTCSIAWSYDLTDWYGITNTDTKLTVVKRIAWNGMYWVAVGAGDVSTIMHSKDTRGLTWEDTFMSSVSLNKTAAVTTMVNDIVWGGGRWVAVGRGNSVSGGDGVCILYSTDTPVNGGTPADYAITGRRWTGVTGSAQLFPYGVNSISWNGKRFVATGPASGTYSTGNIIAWSPDGITWTAYSTAKTIAPGQRWVAVGSGSRACIGLSADGRVWTDISGSALLFADISGASTTLASTMKTGARAIGWNSESLVIGGARSATTVTATSQSTATVTTGRTTIPVYAFIGSGNGVMGGGTTNAPMGTTEAAYLRVSSSVFVTHLDVNMREQSAPWANMWLNTYTDLSGTVLFQVTPETQSFSSAIKWNGWSWVANFGMTTTQSSITSEQFGSIWYCTDPLARVGWSVASNSLTSPRILIGQGGYAALEWNGVAWLACGYDPNNNNLIYTTDKYGAIGWTAVSGIVSGAGSASFQPVCIASSSRVWVVGGSQGTTSALYYTSDRTGATGWRAVVSSVLPGIRITSVGYNGSAWICCGGGGGGSGAPASSISWRADTGAGVGGAGGDEVVGSGWAAATLSGTSGGIPPVMSGSSAIAYNAGAASPIWVVVGDVTSTTSNQIAFTSTVNGSTEWKKPTTGTLTHPTFSRLTGIVWTGYSWIATSGAGFSRLAATDSVTAATNWNNPTNSFYTPTLCTNAVAYADIPISLLTTGMPTSAGAGAGTGAMWRGGVGRAQGILPGGGTETTSVVVRSSNGAEGTSWSQVYSRNFLIAVGGGVIRDASGGGGANRMAYSYDGGLSWTTNTTPVLTSAAQNSVGSIRTVKYGNGMWVAGGDSLGSGSSGGNCLAWSRDGVNWTGAGGTQIFGSAGACYAVCCNDRGRWVAVGGAALTTAGTYTNTSGAIYTMAWSDDGMNWTPVLGSRALFGIVCQGVSYGADASGVGMWTAIGRGGAYTGCAYSYDAKTWYLSQTSGSLFGTSANVLTERYAPVAGANWQSVSVSSTGQYQTALIRSGFIYTSSDYGVTWTSRTAPGSLTWWSISISGTGQYQTACVQNGGYIWTSSDFGLTWTSRVPGTYWNSISVSSTGQYQTAAVSDSSSGNIWTSSDYGVKWTERTTGTPAATRDWRSISISSTGQYQSAVAYGGNIWTSSDYGVNWTERTTGGTRSWSSVSLSSTGQYQTAVVTNGNIYTSSNYGVSWTPDGGSAQNWISVSVSSTGQYQTVIASGGNIYTSSTYGSSWSTPRDSVRNWNAVSISSSGQYQTAVVSNGLIYISSNFGETWSAAANDSRSLSVVYGKDASGVGMWVATAGRRDRDVAASVANTMAYSYDGKLWRGIRASACLSEQAWSVAYGKDGFGVGMWVAAGYDAVCGVKWSYDGVTWNASTGASGAAVWASAAAGRRALCVYWNGSMWLASTSDTRNGEPRGTGIAANNASGVPGYLLYSYNGKNWLPVLAPNTYASTISSTAQPSIYSVLPNPAILDFGSFYDDQGQRGATIANTTARTVGAVMSGGVPIENISTIVPYGRGSVVTGQMPFLLGGDSGLVDTAAGVVGIAGAGAPPPTSELASATTSLSTSVDGGITWRAVPNSTKVMTKVNKILCDETTQQIVAVGTGNYSVATSTPSKAADADGWVGVFGSRMTDTQTGLFERFGTGAAWFAGAKMWVASGRAQSRRGSSLAVSVNGTVWQDAKIVSAVAAGTAGMGRGGGLVGRTTTSSNAYDNFISGPTAQSTNNNWQYFQVNQDRTGAVLLSTWRTNGNPVIPSYAQWDNSSNTTITYPFIQKVTASGTLISSIGGYPFTGPALVLHPDDSDANNIGLGYKNITTNTINVSIDINLSLLFPTATATGINYHIQRELVNSPRYTLFASGSILSGSTAIHRFNHTIELQSGEFVYLILNRNNNYGYDHTRVDFNVNIISQVNTTTVVPYTSATTPLLTYTDSAVAFSTQVGGIAVNSQYNRAVVGGSGVQFVAGGRGGLAVSNDGQTWVAGGASASAVFQTPTNATTRTGSGGFDASFGTVALTQRLTTPATYPSGIWYWVSLSRTGQYQTAMVNAGNIWTSSDYGVTWTERTTGATRAWSSVSVSSTGQYQSAGVDTTSNIWTSSDFGVSWTMRTAIASNISLSSTGQYQSAAQWNGNISTSSDYGANWTSRATSLSWTSISLSSTGQYQSGSVSGGNIWISSDFGVSWSERTTGATRTWRSVSLSSTGQYQTSVASEGNIWTSFDYGVNWTERTTGSTRAWRSVSLSSTGQYQSAVVYSGNIWTSSDFGVTWTPRTAPGSLNWKSISLSSTSQYQTAVVETSGSIYTSTDFGATWVQRSTATRTNAFTRVRSSASGQYQIATSGPVGNTNGQLYVSSDYGQSWIPRRGLATWLGGAVSASGAVMMTMLLTQFVPITTIKINGALSYSPILYLDATNPSSYNGSTWTNLGSLGGNVLMTNMGSFDSTDNGGSFNFNGTTHFGTLSIASTTLTAGTYVAVVKPTTTSINWRTIMDWADDNLFMGFGGVGNYNFKFITGPLRQDSGYALTPDTWYHLLVTFTSGGNVNFYVNGLLVGTAAGETFSKTSSLIGIGCGATNATTGNDRWVGKISSLAIYNRVLTASEVYKLYTSYANNLLRSTDYGMTFSDVSGTTLTGSAYWQSIAMTNSGAVQSAVVYGGSIYRSLDTGVTWSNTGITIDGSTSANTGTPRNWQDIAVAAETGAVQVTCVSGGYLYVSTNTGATWVSASVNIDGVATQTTNRAWRAVAVSANGQYGLACVNSTSASGYIWRSVNSGTTWVEVTSYNGGGGIGSQAWQDVGMSANGKYQVACVAAGLIYYSKNYGASWTSLTAAGSRAWSSVSISENGSTISATTNDASGGVWTYAMPDEQYYRPATLANVVGGGSTVAATIRAVAYGNSGTGSAVDGYWLAGGDASGNTLAYSSNGVDWTAVVGSKTTLFNAVNGVAYGVDSLGAPMWVAVGVPFVGSVPGATAYSIAYSYNMTTWVGVRNAANFTGQGNHVAFGQDEYGAGVWVAVGQGDGSLAANLGDSTFGNSNGNTGATIFYSYDGANWAAGQGAGVFSTSGTDITWGVDASGVATWVATGVGFTDPVTGVFTAGGQVAHSVNGRVWTPISIRQMTAISPALSVTTLPATSRASTITAPPASTGFITPTYSNIWRMLGGDIDGEAANDYSGYSVALSADGTVVAISAYANDGTGTSAGHVRVYKYNPNKTVAQTNQSLTGFGPIGWDRLGVDIDGEAAGDLSGRSVSLSSDGTVVAIGALYNGGTGTSVGHVRVYKYNPNKTVAQTNQSLAGFGPIGWDRLGEDIDGEAAGDSSGESVSLSADGTVVAIGAYGNDGTGSNAGHVRVYKYNPNKTVAQTNQSLAGFGPIGWDRLGEDIDGEAANDYSAYISLSADGTTVAIGALYNDGAFDASDATGHVRVYKYNPNKTVAQTNQSLTGFGPIGWDRLGVDIDGEVAQDFSGRSVRLSADGTVVAIGAYTNDGTANDAGHVRVYKYNPNKTVAQTNQSLAGFGPIGWDRLGADIDGETADDNSGFSVSLSADGTVVAIGAYGNDGTGSNAGHVRVYKYNPNKTVAQTNQSLAGFGPIGWDRIGLDIDGEAANDYSGQSVSLSADGTVVAIGANGNDGTGSDVGHVRVYKIDTLDAITYTSSNPAVAEIYGNTILFIKEDASGSTIITATQSATLPLIVEGTLTVSGTVYTFQYNNIFSAFTPFTGDAGAAALTVAYGRAGSQGSGAPLWIVGGSGGTNVFARSSRPSAGTWTVTASNAGAGAAPFPVCNSLGYSNGVWVAGNNTDATNILARSVDGGATWTPITASSVSGILAGATAMGANAFCNYSLAVADFSNDTNLRSWVAVQGTKNFFFEGGVSAVATVTPDISAAVYGGGSSGRAWWVAGGIGLSDVASIGYTTDPSGATGWTKAASTDIANLSAINAVAFSPFTQRWLAVGAGATGSPGTNILYSDASGVTWTSTNVATAATPVITLHTCVWNQLPTPATVSNAGRWLVGGSRNDGGVNNVDVSNSASVYISTDVSGIATPWTPVAGTGAILSQVYSLAYNGRVWIAAGVRATDGGGGGGTSTLMRTTDPTGASGWVGITATNTSVDGFDTAARSITWNPADGGGMWIATGENTATTGSSMIYSLDISGGAGTWRSVREANSICFSGEGTGLAYTGDRWFAVGDGNRAIVATTGAAMAAASAATWSPVSHGTSITRATDIAYTGRRLIATGSGAGSTTGVILSTDNTGASWSSSDSTGFSDALGGGTSVAFEASYDGVGRVVATGRSATNVLSVSADGGSTWSAPSTQFSSANTVETTTQPLFTTGANSVAYVGNDTLFGIGGNDVHWTGKRWVAVGRNTAAADISGGGGGGGSAVTVTTAGAAGAAGAAALPIPEIINNNTTPIATSDDGITWQCVRMSQAPNLSEGVFVATNSRIGSTPLIDSQILIADGGDTEQNTDYGGMVGGVGGFGTGVCGIDIIAEITPASHAAHSIGAVGIIGAAGNGGANSVGNASTASFDTTAFTITPRPLPRVN